jgi:hypothetical protein
MRAIKILVPVVILTAATYVTAAPNILLLSEPCLGSVEYYPTALTALGYTFTPTNGVPAFYTALTNGTEWDLVLVDQYFSPLDEQTLLSLMNYIAKGGLCILNSWDLDWALAEIFGANMALVDYSYDTPLPVTRWEPANPLFTTPNTIPDLTSVLNTCTTDGFYLQPNDDAAAVAGYTPAAAENQAAIVIGNEGRTILLGITPGLFGPPMEKLLENCIEYLLAPPPAPLSLTLNSLTPAIGSTLTIDVAVQPLTQAFDAWGCIFGPGASAYSFTLGNPTALRPGTSPLVRNIPGLPAAYNIRLLNMTIPPGVSGVYTVVVELTPAGLDPVIPIEGYVSVKTVTVP